MTQDMLPQPSLKTVAALSASVLVGVVGSSATIPAPFVQACEQEMGHRMMRQAIRENRIPAISNTFGQEIIGAFKGGMTIRQIAFCLDLKPASVRMILSAASPPLLNGPGFAVEPGALLDAPGSR